MKGECPECRWFSRDGERQVDGETFVHGSCCRPEGPLDPRTTHRQVYDDRGHVTGWARPVGMPVSCEIRQVSSGMGCKAFEARDPERVTKVTDSGGPQSDLWTDHKRAPPEED